MILLLDANALIWWLANDGSLSDDAAAAIASPMNDVLVSAVTIWEIEVKRAAGKLRAPDDLITRIDAAGFSTIPLVALEATRAARLPRHHTDPFDRLLVAQAAAHGAVIVTRDRAFTDYGVDVLAA